MTLDKHKLNTTKALIHGFTSAPYIQKSIVQLHEKTSLRRKIIFKGNKPVAYTFSMASQNTLHEVSTAMSASQRSFGPVCFQDVKSYKKTQDRKMNA